MCTIKLNLEDDDKMIKLSVNKNDLCTKIPYFNTMLTNFKEKTSNKINCTVPNACIAYDVIMALIGTKINIGQIPEWEHTLKFVECYEYFGLEFDFGLLYNLKIPNEDLTRGFELLIKTFALSSNKFVISQLINKYFPIDYDFSNVSKDILEDLLESIHEYHIISKIRSKILIWNSKESLPSIMDSNNDESNINSDKKLDRLICNCRPILEAPSQSNSYGINQITNKIIFHDSWMTPNIIDIIQKLSVFAIEGEFQFSICVSTDSKLCAYTYGREIYLHDIIQNKLIKKIGLPNKKSVSKIYFSADNSQIVVIIDPNNDSESDDDSDDITNECFDIDDLDDINNKCFDIFLIDIDTDMVTKKSYTNRKIYSLYASPLISYSLDNYPLAFSFDKNFVAIVSKKNNCIINIFDLLTGKIIKQLKGSEPIVHIRYSPGDLQIISVCKIPNAKKWDYGSIKIWDLNTNKISKTLDKFVQIYENQIDLGNLYMWIPNNFNLVQAINKVIF